MDILEKVKGFFSDKARIVLASISGVLLAALIVTLVCSGAGRKAEAVPPQEPEPQKAEAAAPAPAPLKVVIKAGDTVITREDTEGKSIDQLLSAAGVQIKEGDVVTVETDKALSDSIVILINRMTTVKVVMRDAKGAVTREETITSPARSVSEVLSFLGIQLTEDLDLSEDPDAMPADGMTLILSPKPPKAEEKKEEKTDKDKKPATQDSTSSSEDESYSGGDSYYEDDPYYGGSSSEDYPSGGSSSGGSSSGGGSSPSTPPPVIVEPEPEPEPVTIVDVQYYEEPDNPGHGVKVVTYSDGTQEEIEY